MSDSNLSLSTSLNISGPLLELCGIDHLTSKGALNWKGKHIPLLNRPSLKDSAAISTLEAATIPPKSLKMVQAVCPDTINSTFASGTVVVEGDKLLAEETCLAPARNALCTITPEGLVYVPLINPFHHPITIKGGTFYGRAHLTRTTISSNGIQSISMVFLAPSSCFLTALTEAFYLDTPEKMGMPLLDKIPLALNSSVISSLACFPSLNNVQRFQEEGVSEVRRPRGSEKDHTSWSRESISHRSRSGLSKAKTKQRSRIESEKLSEGVRAIKRSFTLQASLSDCTW